MRGKLTEQNLTDYALNELPPEERFYVESMLACSEECREDVYQMLEMSELLKQGFEQDEATLPMELNDVQRAKVLDVPRWDFRPLVQKAAAIALVASGTAYLFARSDLWRNDQLAHAGAAVQTLVSDFKQKGVATTAEEFAARLELNSTWRASAGYLQNVAQPAVCTPPVWTDVAGISQVEM